MKDYSKLYFSLFNAITDALGELEKSCYMGRATEILISAQEQAEEMYISM